MREVYKMLPILYILASSTLIKMAAGGVSPFILDGEETSIDEHPWMVAIEVDGTQKCGGVLISTRRVLTAASCVEEDAEDSIEVRYGSTNREEAGEVEGIMKKVLHKKYDPKTGDNDIVILVLKHAFQKNANAKKIKLLPTSTRKCPVAGTEMFITGWGALREDGNRPDELHQAKLKVMRPDLCKKKAKEESFNITPNMMCAEIKEDYEQVAIEGDYGGPITFNGTLYGISLPHKSVYLCMAKYGAFIREKIDMKE